jgi:hypothetical protein
MASMRGLAPRYGEDERVVPFVLRGSIVAQQRDDDLGPPQLALSLSGGAADAGKPMPVAAAAARDRYGVLRYRRFAGRITGWRAERERLDAIRLNNPLLHRKRALCDAIERGLMGALGVNRYDTDAVKCRVDIEYDPRRINVAQLVELCAD